MCAGMRACANALLHHCLATSNGTIFCMCCFQDVPAKALPLTQVSSSVLDLTGYENAYRSLSRAVGCVVQSRRCMSVGVVIYKTIYYNECDVNMAHTWSGGIFRVSAIR